MNEEEFFNRAINRICKDYDYNFANEFKLLFLKKDKEIERLTKQNKALNEMYELTKKEYIRLNNIIKDIKSQLDYLETHKNMTDIKDCCEDKRKWAGTFIWRYLQELKGENNDKENN